MARYIDETILASAIRDTIHNNDLEDRDYSRSEVNDLLSDLADMLDKLPAIEAPTPHANWNGNDGEPGFRCDSCGYFSSKETPFCPECGSKMRGSSYGKS